MAKISTGPGIILGVMAVSLLLLSAPSGLQAGPADFFKFGGKGVEADPSKEYKLTELSGPWMIMVTSFSGQTAHQDANALVFELRKNYKLKAYVYDKTFTHDLRAEQDYRKRNPYARPHNYQKKGTRQEFVVLVGDFQSVEEKDFQKTLQQVKQCNPQCLQRHQLQGGTSQSYGGWRRNISQGGSPFYMAMAARNPLLPPESHKGMVDEFIESINVKRPYSLLSCPGRYTVLIATFTGRTVIRQDEVKEILAERRNFLPENRSELEVGEQAAERLCKILRARGVEAYVFHDYYSSIVTVGSFQSYGTPVPNSSLINTDPAILKIIDEYKGRPSQQGIQEGRISHEPVLVGGIECDVQPKVMEVPRRRAAVGRAVGGALVR